MARHAETATPVEMLKAQVTMTATGFPATLAVVQSIYGPRVNPAPEASWFWIGATPTSARRIRAFGLEAVGTETTTRIPRQTSPEVVEGPLRSATDPAPAIFAPDA